jgi:cysteine synthase A
MLGLRFIAVMPRSTARSKIAQIEFFGGECHFVGSAPEMHDAAVEMAARTGGYFMDQFMYAERATDWRGNNNIAESIYRQMAQEPYPIPAAIVMSAGTGGTSATLGRYMRYCSHATELVVVDPENSVFYDSYQTGDRTLTRDCSSRIEGIGRPKVEPSFQHDVIDRMIRVPDAASVAAMLWLERLTGRRAGPSTGTNIWGTLQVAREMQAAGRRGSLVTLMCDSGQRYLDTYYDPAWVGERIGEVAPWLEQLGAIGPLPG